MASKLTAGFCAFLVVVCLFVWLMPDGFYVTDRGFIPVFKSTVGLVQDVSVVPRWLWNNTMDLVLGPGSSGAAVVSVGDIPRSYLNEFRLSLSDLSKGLLALFSYWSYPYAGFDIETIPVYCVSASSAVGYAVVDKVYGRVPSDYSDYELYLYDSNGVSIRDLGSSLFESDFDSMTCAVLIRTLLTDRNARYYKTTVCYTRFASGRLTADIGVKSREYTVPQDGAYYISDVNLLNGKYLQVSLVNKSDPSDVVVVSQEIIV